MYEYVVNKSRFIGYKFAITSKKEIEIIIENLRKKHKRAIHFVAAAILEIDKNQIAYINDDGEPKGTAGTPLFKILQINNANNLLLVVVRYWGGAKLGAGLLTRSYTKTAILVFKN